MFCSVYTVGIVKFDFIIGWNGPEKTLTFYNKRKLDFFLRYYSSKYDVLIKVYYMGEWIESYHKGKDIWNCY